MEKLKVLLVLFLSTCHAVLSAITDGLLPNGDFEESPEPKYLLNGTVVKFDTAIPNWRISGIVEYIASPQKQFNNKLVAPQGVHSIKLVTGSSIRQKVELTKGLLYSITLSAARTCGGPDRITFRAVKMGRADAGRAKKFGKSAGLGFMVLNIKSTRAY